MKKSQVLNIIAEELNKVRNSHYEDIAHAKTLLNKLEEIGMLPPDSNNLGCVDPDCCGGPCHDWEYE